jgi:hypothetical protein
MRIAWKFLLVFAVLALGAAAPAFASVPKVIFADEFGWAT